MHKPYTRRSDGVFLVHTTSLTDRNECIRFNDYVDDVASVFHYIEVAGVSEIGGVDIK